ncbi:putative protein BONZAI [Arabidopsis thaliana]
METEMDFSDGEQTNGNSHVTASQYFAPPGYNRSLVAAYGNGNTTIGLEKGIERRLDHHEQLPGYILCVMGERKPIATVTVFSGFQEEEKTLLRV